MSEYYPLRDPGCEVESTLSISFFLWYLWMVNSTDYYNSDCCLPQNSSCEVESSPLINFFLWCLRIVNSPILTTTIIVGPQNPWLWSSIISVDLFRPVMSVNGEFHRFLQQGLMFCPDTLVAKLNYLCWILLMMYVNVEFHIFLQQWLLFFAL